MARSLLAQERQQRRKQRLDSRRAKAAGTTRFESSDKCGGQLDGEAAVGLEAATIQPPGQCR
eukprot:CAMPEP_0179162244 /NCGR_PEP_ID=MMETSP0796-20121207/79471_1 /TAXON_ID=73915 /ORGANISM="Pyrodinium bahamense, Strain pbaha01" /LENGTH=61 /DNA_ID=CAMNT_0020864431 /DNA_START=20 /DNA_END=202 /DNA_ORIENTATION=-